MCSRDHDLGPETTISASRPNNAVFVVVLLLVWKSWSRRLWCSSWSRRLYMVFFLVCFSSFSLGAEFIYFLLTLFKINYLLFSLCSYFLPLSVRIAGLRIGIGLGFGLCLNLECCALDLRPQVLQLFTSPLMIGGYSENYYSILETKRYAYETA